MKQTFITGLVSAAFYAIILGLAFYLLLPEFTENLLNAWGYTIDKSVLRATWGSLGAIFVTLKLTNKII